MRDAEDNLPLLDSANRVASPEQNADSELLIRSRLTKPNT